MAKDALLAVALFEWLDSNNVCSSIGLSGCKFQVLLP